MNLNHTHLWGPIYCLIVKSIESYERAYLLENEIDILIERNGNKNQCPNISALKISIAQWVSSDPLFFSSRNYFGLKERH